jgi:uncharacterized repeat protein (TIGR03803 family)
VTFEPGGGGTLYLDKASDFTGTVTGLAQPDSIDLADFAFSSHPVITNVTGTGTAGSTTDVTIADGSQTTALHLLNQHAGEYSLESTAYHLDSDNPSSASAGTLFSTVPNPLTAAGASITGTEGLSTGTSTVATFTDVDPNATASDFTASIDWGDGTTTTGTIVAQNGGGFAVDGTHTYAEEGKYAVGVTITDAGGSTTSAGSSATVADAPLSATSVSISGTEGSTTGTIPVATFTDANPNATVSDFTATIDWGDGATSAGTIVAQSGGGFAVDAAHTYADEGEYTVGVSINDAGGSTASATSKATVADIALANGSSYDKITLGNGERDTVYAGRSNNDAITLGDGINDFVSADFSSYDKITLGNGERDTVTANGSSYDAITDVSGSTASVTTSATVVGTVTLSTLVTFNGANGAEPFGSLIADAHGDLFGTTVDGGANITTNAPRGDGTVFEIAKTATGYASTPTTLVSFNDANGAEPLTLIADAQGNLFGTTITGGQYGHGTVYEIVKTAHGYASSPTTLVSFNGADGRNPQGSLIADAHGDLFGTTAGPGGPHGFGTVFEIAKTAHGYASTPTTLVGFNFIDGNPTAPLTL